VAVGFQAGDGVAASNTVAVGATSNAGANGAVAVGAAAVASQASAVALGAGSQATAANSVALGAGSVANQADTVSVGAVGGERRIVNVADGTAPTDAVNLGQLTQSAATTLSQANAYTNLISRRADAATAAAMAVAFMPQPVTAGRGMLSAGFGVFNGQAGFAVGGGVRLNDNHTTFRAGVNFTAQGRAGGGAGVGWEF
jgi:autotransporter adhesin